MRDALGPLVIERFAMHRGTHTYSRALRVLIVSLIGVGITVRAEAAETPVALSAHAGGEWFDYAEDLEPPLKSSERGPLVALGLEARLPAPTRLFLRGRFDVTFGRTQYDGSTLAGRPVEGSTSNVMLRPEIDVGMREHLTARLHLVEYLGLGAHYWRRDLRALPGGYREDYSWFHAAIGVIAELSVGERMTVALDGAVVPAFAASVKAHLDDLDARVAPVTLRPEAHMGLRVRASLSLAVTERLFVTLLTSWEWSSLEESAVVAVRGKDGSAVVDGTGAAFGVQEPSSRTHRVTGVASAGWRF